MANTGWIKIHRKIQDSPMYQSLTSKQRDVLHQCLLLANHQEQEWVFRGVTYKCQPGEFITSLPSLMGKCAKDLTRQNIRTALLLLQKWGFLTDESTNSNRLIKIVAWQKYQCEENITNQRSNQQLTNDQPTANQQLTPNKNNKEVKNDKNKRIYVGTSEEVRLATYLFNKIKEQNPYVKPPDIQKWAKHMGGMLRIDMIPAERIEKMIDWAKQDVFWAANILSAESLRKHFPKMYEAAKRQFLERSTSITI